MSDGCEEIVFTKEKFTDSLQKTTLLHLTTGFIRPCQGRDQTLANLTVETLIEVAALQLYLGAEIKFRYTGLQLQVQGLEEPMSALLQLLRLAIGLTIPTG
ncbi:hypothetical protein [Streptococcus danieliae]|uniref:hypothetical protein n=1 Tax=Streptococcus danieliae TaxID=747656 RepID=UPI0026F058D1|nr:hypothetical protein [Streptococcus danieliae]